MEIYLNSVDVAKHEVYVGDMLTDPDDGIVSFAVIDPSITNGNDVVASGEAVQIKEGVYQARLGVGVSGNRRPKLLAWSYTIDTEAITTHPEEITVVRPYISLQDYNSRFPYRPLDMKHFRVVERTVRRVIDAYCRQSFQLRENETRVVPGGSTNTLQLPDRLLNLGNVTAGGSNGYSLASSTVFDSTNPWAIYTTANGGALSPRQTDPLERTQYFRNVRYYITGDWGWRNVPQPVTDAAAILINDFLDDDAVYREKYIDNIRAADWRMEFAATGNETTGNANADMMLEKFRSYRPEVV